MSQYSEDGIVDVEKRTKEIGKILNDPTLFPVEFLNWLKRYIEQSGITLPASSIIGGFKPGAGSVRNLAPGLILPFAGGSPPSGSLACDGQGYVRDDYPLLFAEIGTAYGAPSPTTFNVPDLRGRSPVGQGTHVDVDTIGESDGAVPAARTPKHSHGGNTGNASPGTNSQGSHSHGGGTGNAGGHDHTVGAADAVTGVQGPGAFSMAINTHSHDVGAVGDHAHSIGGDGGHSHTVNAHGHTIPGDGTPYLVVAYVITTGQ